MEEIWHGLHSTVEHRERQMRHRVEDDANVINCVKLAITIAAYC